jgi:hypothetical protein
MQIVAQRGCGITEMEVEGGIQLFTEYARGMRRLEGQVLDVNALDS